MSLLVQVWIENFFVVWVRIKFIIIHSF